MVSLGLIEPEGLGDGDISNKEAQQLSRCLSKAAQSWIAAKGLKISDGITQIFGCYPVKEETRKTRLRNVIFEIEEYTGEQFAEEKEAIAGLLALFKDDESVSPDDVIVRLYQSAHS